MNPSTIPKLSLITFTKGAKQFVVHDAFDTTVISDVYFSWLTPITNIGASPDGALITTFFAPAFICADAFSIVVNTPVDSTTYSAPHSVQPISAGSFAAYTEIFLPFTTSFPSSVEIVPLNLPCTVSVSYTHLRAHETRHDLVCRLLLE